MENWHIVVLLLLKTKPVSKLTELCSRCQCNEQTKCTNKLHGIKSVCCLIVERIKTQEQKEKKIQNGYENSVIENMLQFHNHK